VLTMAIGCLFNSLLLDHTEGLLYAWLTGVLYAGLQSKRDA
jgi:O-antigen ligase